MKKAIIFGFLEFPHGSASANYVQNLAFALRSCGYTVWIISSGDIEKCAWIPELNCYEYQGLYFIPYKMLKNKILHYLQFKCGLGYLVIKYLKKLSLNSQDIIISYSMIPTEMEPVFRFAQKRKLKTIACITELFPPDYFPRGEKSFAWKQYSRGINYSVLMADKQWVISHFIKQYYDKKGGDTLCFPALTDVGNARNLYEKRQHSLNVVKIAFTGNRGIKDALRSMTQSVIEIQKQIPLKIEFHITGVTKSYFNDIPNIEKFLGETIIIHSWMSYDELCYFYSTMDFILLARETNQTTLANFPSKIPEAMGFGVIPIVSRVGDYTKYYLKDNINSIVFEGSSPQACKEAILRAINLTKDDRKALSKAARKCAEEFFDYHIWSPKIQKHLDN